MKFISKSAKKWKKSQQGKEIRVVEIRKEKVNPLLVTVIGEKLPDKFLIYGKKLGYRIVMYKQGNELSLLSSAFVIVNNIVARTFKKNTRTIGRVINYGIPVIWRDDWVEPSLVESHFDIIVVGEKNPAEFWRLCS